MSEPPSELEVYLAHCLLISEHEDHPDFAEALFTLSQAVENGAFEYAGLLAELLAFDGPHHDAAKAYVFYYVAHKEDGYLVSWSNEADDPCHYVGPDGDFRNEPMVSDLMQELGLEALPALEERAAALMRQGS